MEGVDLLTGVIFPYINLAIFLVLATLMLRGPIKKALFAKREAYLDLVKKAGIAKDEAFKRQHELKDRLSQLDKEIEGLRTQAKIQAEQEAKVLIANAEQLAEHMKREARRIAEAELASAKSELRQEIIKQVRQETIVQLQQSLDASRQHQLVQLSVASLAQVPVEVKS
ncbi:MAG: ATP synthase F0 subunit B [Proteobacteria bacterium]|nr:ATP synthase F0 subunit B [Pseudomonadota bacterium]